LLADSRLDINKARTDDGITPLFMAAQNGHRAVVKLLLADSRLDINKARTDNGATPLLVAAGNGHHAVVQLLLADSRLDINKRSIHLGLTALDVAAHSGHVGCVVFLATDARTTQVDPRSEYFPKITQILQTAAAQNHPGAIAWLQARNLPVPPCTVMVPADEFFTLSCDECGIRCKPNYCARCNEAKYCGRDCKLGV
jgi:hypothetical protein